MINLVVLRFVMKFSSKNYKGNPEAQGLQLWKEVAWQFTQRSTIAIIRYKTGRTDTVGNFNQYGSSFYSDDFTDETHVLYSNIDYVDVYEVVYLEPRQVICPRCNGTRVAHALGYPHATCSLCNGKGTVIE